MVCIECKISIESFVNFCEKVDSNQKMLREQITLINVKEEEINHIVPPSPPHSMITTKESPKEIQSDSNLAFTDDASSVINIRIESVQGSLSNSFSSNAVDEDDTFNAFEPFAEYGSDFEPVNEDLIAAQARSVSEEDERNLREPPVVDTERIKILKSQMKRCFVPVTQLPIKFVPSDTEDDDDEDDPPSPKIKISRSMIDKSDNSRKESASKVKSND